MLNKPKQLPQQITELADYLDLNEYVVEKDWYVTKAIAIVTQIPNDYFDLVFQGGTSLAKAHRIIERMSEDCDFRVRLKASGQGLSKEFKRRALRQFRHDIVDALQTAGFTIDSQAVRVRNEGKFMGLRAEYPSDFAHIEMMKPFIALEFFLAEVKVAPAVTSITTLIGQVFGDAVGHPEFSVQSVAVLETAAEKWVGLTRRIATSRDRQHYRDPNLVRHLYDLYQIDKQGFFSDENKFISLAEKIVADDRRNYKNHNTRYYTDPTSEIQCAVDELQMSTMWHDNWDKFIDVMVFSKEKPSYEVALENLRMKTAMVLTKLK